MVRVQRLGFCVWVRVRVRVMVMARFGGRG